MRGGLTQFRSYAEHMALAYFNECGLPAVVLRPFNVYGPGQVGEGALSTFVKRALRGEELLIYGDGTQIRAWCYVSDMVRATIMVMDHPDAIGETFNIGNQRAVITVYGLASTVVRILNSSSTLQFIRRDLADVELRIPNVTKSLERLGFAAEVELEQGISLTANFFRERQRLDS